MTIPVIALNDDNHSKAYVTRGSYYNNAADFMKECLLKSHTVTYEIKEVYLCYPEGDLANIDEEKFLNMFDLLYLTYEPGELAKKDFSKWEEREKVFDLFWKNGSEWQYA